MAASVCFSSSVGFAGRLEVVTNWEYLWKYASVCWSSALVLRNNVRCCMYLGF